LGVKTLLLDNLTVNAAGFYATRENADLNNTAFTLVQVASERSQGMELNVLGNITERWSATANYAYTDVRLFDPLTPAFDGNQQRNVPYNSANFWTRYNVIQDECQTFGGAIGLVYLDNRPGDLTNTFDLPSFARWDAGLFYNRGRGYASLYAENLFDKYYAASSIDALQVMPGAPANLRATVGFVY
jgi:iron complex outermembrane receptor protein